MPTEQVKQLKFSFPCIFAVWFYSVSFFLLLLLSILFFNTWQEKRINRKKEFHSSQSEKLPGNKTLFSPYLFCWDLEQNIILLITRVLLEFLWKTWGNKWRWPLSQKNEIKHKYNLVVFFRTNSGTEWLRETSRAFGRSRTEWIYFPRTWLNRREDCANIAHHNMNVQK